MSEGDGISSLLFYIFFVHPVCSWILAPGRFKKSRSIIYAIIFLATIAVAKLGFEWMEKGPNYYQQLGVTRNSSAIEIKRAYKKVSLELHPDKNPSPEAADDFAQMKEAYDVLIDLELRPIYDKLGPDGIKHNKRLTDEYQLLLEIAIFYVSWGVLSYVLTLGKSSANARNWIFTGEIVMMVMEVSMLLVSGDPSVSSLPTWFFPSVTEHEVIWVLHSMFPAYMNGCRSLGSFLYVDVDKQTREMLLALQEGHKDVLMILRDIQINIANLQTGGGVKNLGGPGASRPIASKATPTGKLKDMEERMKMNASGVNEVAAQIKGTQKSSGGSFWWFILAYVVFYYLVGK